MTTLTSSNNPRIKQIRQLLAQHKERLSTGLFVVEGIHHVGEAVAARVNIDSIYYSPDLLTSDFALQLVKVQSQLGTPCFSVEKKIFTSLASKDNPQGIIAVVHQPMVNLRDLSPQKFNFGVALVAPQDPGNIGTILRTIDAVGASGLLLLDDPGNNQHSTDPYHPSAVRACMGTIFWLPLVSATFSEFTHWAKANHYTIYGTSAHAAQDYRQVDVFRQPLIILMGSEREGLTPSQSAICDSMITLPMKGRASSLNLAVATGVMLYQVMDRLG